MKAFVSGAGGFIGQQLCQGLREHSFRVVAGLHRDEKGPWDETILFDLAGEPVPSPALQGVSHLFHLAGKAHALGESASDAEGYSAINVDGTRKLLESARSAGVKRFIFFSSVKACGEGSRARQDERCQCVPETPYGKSKLQAEQLVLNGGYVPEPVVLRLTMVYGPSERGNLPRMIKAVAKGRFPPLPELDNKRSMVYVDDVVQAAILAAQKSAAVDQIYNITDGSAYSTRQVYEWICEALGKPVARWKLPIGVLKILAAAGDLIGGVRGRHFMFDSAAMDKLVGSAYYSSTKAEQELGYRPQNDLRSALPEIIAGMRME